MNEGRNVFIQCRCNNRWHEPEITRADFLALTCLPDTTTYASVKESVAAMGRELRRLSTLRESALGLAGVGRPTARCCYPLAGAMRTPDPHHRLGRTRHVATPRRGDEDRQLREEQRLKLALLPLAGR